MQFLFLITGQFRQIPYKFFIYIFCWWLSTCKRIIIVQQLYIIEYRNYHHPNHKGIKEEEQSSTSQPLIRPIWAGSLSVNWSSGDSVISRRVLEGVFGHVSTRSCHKVYAEASKFQPILQFDLLRRHPSVWPKSFRELGPSDDSIAVYFFPSLGDHHEEIYDRLIFDMIRDDLAMRTVVHTAELLVFPSIMLPSRFWRFQGKLYLWGVFRQKPTC